MHLKITTQNRVVALSFQNTDFRDFLRDNETLNTTTDPNVSWNMSELIKNTNCSWRQKHVREHVIFLFT